jgi:hypothetical protein
VLYMGLNSSTFGTLQVGPCRSLASVIGTSK